MNFSIKICKQTVNIISPKIHTLFTLYSLIFGSACAIIGTESEGKPMGVYVVKIFEYHKKNGTHVLANSPKEAIAKVKEIKGIPQSENVLAIWKKIS